MIEGIIVHQRGWLAYWRGIDSRKNKHDDPAASAWRGFWRWVRGIFYRGYATDDDGTPYDRDVYVCPWASAKLLAHEFAHTNVFGRDIPTLEAPRLASGGLDHEPLHTRDIMLPGYFSPFRKTDRRGITHAAGQWTLDGRARFVEE